MAKIQNISEIHPTLGFTEFDILEKYRKSFHASELGSLHSVFPFESIAKEVGLSQSRLGRRNSFSPSAKIALIRMLNPIIQGWSNYYKSCSCGKVKVKMDYLLYKKIRRWADRRHPNKCKTWVSRKYYHTLGKNHWRFGVWLKKNGEKMLFALKSVCDVPKTDHVLIVGESNPYDVQWKTYFDKRHTRNLLEHFNGQYAIRNLWEKQMRRCKVCGEPITTSTQWIKTHRIVNNKRISYLVHEECCKFINPNEWRLLENIKSLDPSKIY